MKTYASLCALLLLVITGCSKSDNGTKEEVKNTSIEADYAVLLNNDGLLIPQLLNANGESITLNPEKSSLAENAIPDLSVVDGSFFLQYHKDGSCGGQITKHDFKSDASTEIAVFPDLNDCNLTATAIAKTDNALYISYTVTSTDSADYLVRVIDLNASEFSSVDVILNKKPVDLTIANNRLFILTLDELITDENSLSVMDMSNNTLIHEMDDLGYGVRRIFTDMQDNVIISYDELHSNLNSSTMAIVHTQYVANKNPRFAASKSRNFDSKGRLYYASEPDVESDYPIVAVKYDFTKSLLVLYVYEEILSEEQRNFEYEIKTTTTVGYDEKNNMVLVGYEKNNSADKEGGILRIQLKPDEEKIIAIDNINLDGIPTEIFVN